MFALGSFFAVAMLLMAALNLRPDANRSESASNHVRIYCAASVVKPVHEVIESYNREFGANVEIVRTGGSGELAGQIKLEFETDLNQAADLFLSADDAVLEKVYQAGAITERFPIALQRPIIAVRADSTIDVSSLRELVSSKLKFGIASEHAAVGKIVRTLAGRDGVLNELEAQKTTEAENVMTLAQALATGSLDAAVLWDTTVNQMNQAAKDVQEDVLKIAAFADKSNLVQSNISIGLLSNSLKTNSAAEFCRHLSSSNTSRDTFQRYGFTFISDDQ